MNFDEFKISSTSKAILVSLVNERFEYHRNMEETIYSLNELRELMRTLNIEVIDEVVQIKKNLDPASMLGKGKLEEIKELCEEKCADLLVFDFELTAGQVKNIKNITKIDTIDRNSVILEIFAQHAQSRESKIQIEISRLQYLLPRLTSMWGHFTKQKGGIGLKGEGEQQLELDRRMVRRKIEHYKKILSELKISKIEQSKKRQQKAVIAALIGYTNAGKTSLLNKLCKTNKLAEDKLFATLDAVYRTLNPDSKPPMLLIDTVGFISNLSSTLVEGFKTTLESAKEADLLIIVVDLSDPNYEKHINVTLKVLEEIDLQDKEKIIVFNKCDKLNNPITPIIAKKRFINSFQVSTLNEQQINNLRSYIINYFLETQEHFDLFIPYSEGQAHSLIRSKTNILAENNHEEGIFYRVRIPDEIFQTLGLEKFILAPDHQNAPLLK